jgi:hypothetical protein
MQLGMIGLVEAGQGLRWIPQEPEGLRGIGTAGHTRIQARAEYRRPVLGWHVAGDAVLQVLAGRRQRAQE